LELIDSGADRRTSRQAEKESAEASRKDAEAYAQDTVTEGRLVSPLAQQSECERFFVHQVQHFEAQLASEHNMSHRKALQAKKLETEFRLLEKRAHQFEERRLSHERMMQKHLRLVGERQHSAQEPDRTHDASRKHSLLEKKRHVEHEIIAAEAKITQYHAYKEEHMQHVDESAIHHIEEAALLAKQYGQPNPDMDSRIHQAQEMSVRRSKRSLCKAQATPREEQLTTSTDENFRGEGEGVGTPAQVQPKLSEKAELEKRLKQSEACVERECKTLTRHKSLSTLQKKESEMSWLSEIRRIVANRKGVQVELLGMILSEVRAERLVQSSLYVSWSVANMETTVERHHRNEELRMRLLHESHDVCLEDTSKPLNPEGWVVTCLQTMRSIRDHTKFKRQCMHMCQRLMDLWRTSLSIELFGNMKLRGGLLFSYAGPLALQVQSDQRDYLTSPSVQLLYLNTLSMTFLVM